MEISVVSWNEAQLALRHIRQKVFVEEQGVPEDLEWDGNDTHAVHLLGKEGSRPIACARITEGGQLGRVAVLEGYRKNGWGKRILRTAEGYLIDQGKSKIYLSSQANSYFFYFNRGYRPSDGMFWDANIPHLKMQKILSRTDLASHIFLLGSDNETHHSKLPAASAVWFQLGSNQCRRSIDIELVNLTHPVFNNAFCLENLTAFLRQSNQTQIRILLNKEPPSLSEHPLLLCQQKLSSRFKIRCIDVLKGKEPQENAILFDTKGYLRFSNQTSDCYFNNPLAVRRHKQHFELLWENAKDLIEGRKLFI